MWGTGRRVCHQYVVANPSCAWRRKQKLVDAEAMFGRCLITTLARSLWEESQSETICVPKLEKQVFCVAAWLLYYFVKVPNKSLKLYVPVSWSLCFWEFKCTFSTTVSLSFRRSCFFPVCLSNVCLSFYPCGMFIYLCAFPSVPCVCLPLSVSVWPSVIMCCWILLCFFRIQYFLHSYGDDMLNHIWEKAWITFRTRFSRRHVTERECKKPWFTSK